MQVNPYLFFTGNCAEAFKYYEEVIGGTELMMMTNGESPVAEMFSPDTASQIIHARIKVGDTLLMGSDGPSERVDKMGGFAVSLMVDTPEKAEEIFAALSDGGTVRMPMEETFWAFRFGMLRDRFGVSWMVNCEKPM